MTRTLRTMKLHLTAWPSWAGWPWTIMASSLLLNILIAARIDEPAGEQQQTGGMLALMFVLLFSGIQPMTQIHPFAAALAVTRRRFAIATGLFVLGTSLLYGAVLYLAGLVEDATGGWGVDLAFFRLDFLLVDDPLLQILVYAGPLLAIVAVGAFAGVMHARCGPNGLFVTGLGWVVLIGGILASIAWTDSWGTVGDWLSDASPVLLLAAIPAAVAAALAAATWGVLRRTTP